MQKWSTIPGALQLSPGERRIIQNMHEDGQPIDEIATAVGHVRRTVYNFLKSPERLQASERCGRPGTVGVASFQRINIHADKGHTTSIIVKILSYCPL